MDELFLVYIKPIGENIKGDFEYEFMYSETPDVVWGNNWEQTCPAICGDLTPDLEYIHKIERVILHQKLTLAIENTFFSMQDVADGILALAWGRIDNKLIVLKFNESIDYIKAKLQN